VKLVKILLPIDQRGTTEACAKFAFGLAGRSGAALEVLHACPAPTDRLPYATELSPVYFEELVDVGKKQVELEQRQAQAWLAATSRAFPNVRATFLHLEDPVTHTVATRAKAADLTVLPSIAASADPFFALARDAALFNSGRPMLVLPNETRGFNASTVAIAWKDTVEAVRALAASEPFLAPAKHVKLISIAEYEDEDETPAMMAQSPGRSISRLPGARMIASYRGEWLSKDVVAGLVLTALLIPQGMAYAELAGLPAITGLYTSILCLIGYAAFGPSRILVLGPAE
jgi:hypothetical protein